MDIHFLKKYKKYKYKYTNLKAGGRRGTRGGVKTKKKKENFETRLLEYEDIYMNPIFIDINVKDNIYDCKSYNYYLGHKKKSCNQDKLCIFIGDRCKNINPQDDISEEQLILQPKPYERCIDMKGISQTTRTCWFDSVIMALITDFEMRQIWGPYLYSKFGYILNELDNISNRRQLLSTLSPIAKTFKSGIPLKKALLDNGLFMSLLNFYFTNNYNQQFKTNKILYCSLNEYNTQILIIDKNFIKINANNIFNISNETADGKLYVFDHIKLSGSDKIVIIETKINSLPPLELNVNEHTYNLKSIVLGGNGHAISILKCNNNWYIYDNENSKRNISFKQLKYGILNIDSIDYLYQFENIGPINTGYFNLNIPIDENTYYYCKK